MDISMPKLGGFEAVTEIKNCAHAKILILSQYDDKEYISRFLKAGVSGYLLKRQLATYSDKGHQENCIFIPQLPLRWLQGIWAEANR
jgi:DNA-binding NarL/FixJ family response regulator